MDGVTLYIIGIFVTFALSVMYVRSNERLRDEMDANNVGVMFTVSMFFPLALLFVLLHVGFSAIASFIQSGGEEE